MVCDAWHNIIAFAALPTVNVLSTACDKNEQHYGDLKNSYSTARTQYCIDNT